MMPYKRPITLFIRSLFRECDLKEKKRLRARSKDPINKSFRFRKFVFETRLIYNCNILN